MIADRTVDMPADVLAGGTAGVLAGMLAGALAGIRMLGVIATLAGRVEGMVCGGAFPESIPDTGAGRSVLREETGLSSPMPISVAWARALLRRLAW